MFDIKEIFNKYNMDETIYNNLLKDCSDKINGLSEMDWIEISEKYNLGFAGDTLRKAQQVPLVGGQFIREYYMSKLEENMFSNEYSTQIDNQLRKLEREKVKFRDERNAWNKQNYNTARTEQKLDYLEEVLKTFGKNIFVKNKMPIVNHSDNEMIIMLSDLHIGGCFDNSFGSFNSDIAKERLDKYFDYVCEYAELYKVSKVTIVALGDLLNGNIHHSIQVTNRENVIDQIKLASELIAEFCYKCSNIFEHIDFYNVSGNHSRISTKDDAIHSERLDDLIGWIVSKTLSHIDNFKYIKSTIDNGISSFNICGNQYVCIHGDYDASNTNGVASLSLMLGVIPYAILRGHFHTPSYNEVNGVKIIQGGSLVGSGDQYTLEKRLTGKPSQTILICNEQGIKTHIPVEL